MRAIHPAAVAAPCAVHGADPVWESRSAAPAYRGGSGDGDTPFEDVQYTALASLVQNLLEKYPHAQLAGHSDIAPVRKTDPGKYFDWAKFQKETGISSEKLPYGLVSR